MKTKVRVTPTQILTPSILSKYHDLYVLICCKKLSPDTSQNFVPLLIQFVTRDGHFHFRFIIEFRYDFTASADQWHNLLDFPNALDNEVETFEDEPMS